MTTQMVAQKTELPAHLQDVFGDVEANIRTGVSVASLRFKNKIWSVHDGDKVTPIMVESGGETMASPFVDVVIVGKNPERSRLFYAGAFDPESNEPPTCSSSDGVAPDPNVTSPQSSACAMCPQNIKGSKMAKDGLTPIKACSSVQRLAVVPADDLGSKPLLLSFRGRSMYDPENQPNETMGRYCYGGYEKSLLRDGINNVIKVVTRISFDARPEIDGPKLLFKRRDGWLDADAARKAVAHMRSEAVAQLLSGRVTSSVATPAPALAAPTTAAIAAPVAEAPKPVDTPKPKKTAPAPALKTVETPPQPAAPVVSEEDDIEAIVRAEVIARRAAAATAAKPSVKTSTVSTLEAPEIIKSPELDALLGNWGKV